MIDGVLIVIPTRKRWAKLMKVLNSVPDLDWIRICVVCDGDADTYERLISEQGFQHEDRSRKFVRLLPAQKGAVEARNYILQHVDAEYVICATDDITFDDTAIRNAMKCMRDKFSDGDGVIGFRQRPHSFHETGVVLVGEKWLTRYPHKWMYYPDYFHFACQEILWLADKIGDKFYQCPNAMIEHLHPAFNKGEMDITHVEARRYKQSDHDLIYQRQSNGEVWGNVNDKWKNN